MNWGIRADASSGGGSPEYRTSFAFPLNLNFSTTRRKLTPMKRVAILAVLLSQWGDRYPNVLCAQSERGGPGGWKLDLRYVGKDREANTRNTDGHLSLSLLISDKKQLWPFSYRFEASHTNPTVIKISLKTFFIPFRRKFNLTTNSFNFLFSFATVTFRVCKWNAKWVAVSKLLCALLSTDIGMHSLPSGRIVLSRV